MEKPILFSTEMVRAILEGRKTQTRRVIKPQPKFQMRQKEGKPLTNWFQYSESPLADPWANSPWGYMIKCPYQPGDILWVRETWGTGGYFPSPCAYKADGKEYPGEKWRPSIYMPREAARLFLRVKNVRVERLQDITEEDARSEGVKDPYDYQHSDYYEQSRFRGVEINKCAFAGLWDSLNAKRGYGWDTNPWVWVIEFERIKP